MTHQEHLEAIFQADRALREHEEALFDGFDATEIVALLEDAARDAAAMADIGAASMRLERVADLCAQVPNVRAIDVLIGILDHGDESVRTAASEALVDIGMERWRDVAASVERVLESGKIGPGTAELPWILGETGEETLLPLVRRFCGHQDAETVASAIEVLMHSDDTGATRALEKLLDDKREVTTGDDGGDLVTLGELARDALRGLAPAHKRRN